MPFSSPWSSPGPSGHARPPPRPAQYRATSAPGDIAYYHAQPLPPLPPPPIAPIPPSLIPGAKRRQTTDGRYEGLFFMPKNSSYSVLTNGSAHPSVSTPEILVPLKRLQHSAPPPIPKKPVFVQRISDPPPPALPPKPNALPSQHNNIPPPLSFYPQSIPRSPTPLPPPLPSPPSSSLGHTDEDKAMVLAMQASAKRDRDQQQQQQTTSREDEELARALEESMALESPLLLPHGSLTPGRASSVEHSPISHNPPPPLTPTLAHRSLTVPASAPASMSMYGNARGQWNDSFLSLASSQSTHMQLMEDEALARRLAAEDTDDDTPSPELRVHDMDFASPSATSNLPLYSDVVAPHTGHSPNLSRASLPVLASPSRDGSSDGHSTHSTSSRSSSLFAPNLRRASSAEAVPHPIPLSNLNIAPRPVSTGTALSGLASVDEDHEDLSEAQLYSAANSNQYVDAEMLLGVSFGFQPPAIGVTPTRSRDPPNVFSLPYGKCPPMHIQAPSWRHLLRLMAKLSATRIEPAIQALAETKADLKLRTVVQFIKVHHSSSEWRTLIYLTIDYPLSPNHPQSYKYTNGDVSTLPYSYTLSSLPALLRDGADSPMAKYYTIPATASTPLPSLPINLPSYAMYLASALEDSRRSVGDSSSGMRKLAKMVEQFYPDEVSMPAAISEGAETAERGGARRLYRRLIGRGNKGSKGGGNSDQYADLVTPWVPDQWG